MRGKALTLGLCILGATWLGCTPEEAQAPEETRPGITIEAAEAPTVGLVGQWKLDEMGGNTAVDTKNGYNATVLGGAAFVAGKIGRALNLNNGTAGTGGKYAEMPGNATLDNVQEGDYTISAWFFPYTVAPDATNENKRWAIVAKAGFHMGLMYEPDQRFSIRHYLTGPVLKNPHSANTYALNSWHHVAGVVSKTAGTVTLYVNGVNAGSATFQPNTAAHEYNSARFRIGKGSSNWAADGKVDQVRIYNRALSPAEIGDLYAETVGGETASNCIGAPADDKTTYSEKRAFLESQAWWGERNTTNGSVPTYGDAEHIHVGLCFPVADTVSGMTTFVVRVMGHNLPVGSIIKSTSFHDPNDGTNHIGLASVAWNHTITQADHDDLDGWVKWDTVQINTVSIPNGLREVRNLTKVVRPPESGQSVGAEIHASSGWCWTIENGSGAPVASGTCATNPTATMARGWYDCFEYKIAEVRDWDPYTPAPRGTDFLIKIGARDGAGANTTLTRYEVRLNPNFHHGDIGFRVDSGGGQALAKTVTIPAGRMTGPAVHKLVIMAFANSANCTGGVGISPQKGELGAVFSIPIQVN